MALNDLYLFVRKFSFSHADVKPEAGRPSGDSVPADAFPDTAIRRQHPGRFRLRPAAPVCRTADGSQLAVDLVVEGSVSSDSDLFVFGIVNGDACCRGDIEIRGKVLGSVHACNVRMAPASEVTGDVVAEQGLLLDGGIINGSVQSCTATVNGTVNGSVTTSEALEIKSGASVKGDVTAARVAIEHGAVVFGKFAAG